MARPKFQAPPGTRDLVSPHTDRVRELVDLFAELAGRAGFGQVVPPMFEDAGVFARLGEASDVVSKELYDFVDKGDRRLALRPEFTASVCRMFAELRPLTPWKSWYFGPSFRYDRPQKGRYRQFDQVGVEAVGSDDVDVDVECIALASSFYESLGFKGVSLLVNTLGDVAERPTYLAALRDYFEANRDALSPQSLKTLQVNPLRVLDSKRDSDASVVASAPVVLDYLSAEAERSFGRVQAGLKALNIDFVIEPKLVRGLDYYTRTTFEFVSSSLDSAQNAVGGGGRYDGLVSALGGPDEPGVGFALGVDRTLLAADAEGLLAGPERRVDVWVVATTEGSEALALTDELRRGGLRVDRSFGGRSMKAQMKGADRSKAVVGVILGPDELASDSVSIRSLVDGDQSRVPRSQMLSAVKVILS